MSENHLPDASRQAFQTQSVLKSPLETPEPHVCGGTSMRHTIELVTETCHDAPLHFLLMGLEASFVKGFASVGQFVSHRGLARTKDPKLSTKTKWLEPIDSFCPFPAVKMAGSVRSFMMRDPVGSRQLDTMPSLVICTKKRLHENPMGRQHHIRFTSE